MFNTIKDMEDFLLQHSSLDDVKGIKMSDMIQQNPNQILSADDVRREISVFARLLIRAYVGWPVHNKDVKNNVLNHLINMYQNAHDKTTVQELFDAFGNAISFIPDNHISVFLNNKRKHTGLTRNHIDVGKNIAGDKQIITKLENGIAIIGFRKMLRTDEFKAVIEDFIMNILPKSSSLIIDLRGNSGGSSKYSDMFADYLCGTRIPSAKQMFIRNTPEMLAVQSTSRPDRDKLVNHVFQSKQLMQIGNDLFNGELIPTDFAETADKCKIDNTKAYMKPIYILTDSYTGSSAEMFLLHMVHHPMVTVVGDNSAGMELYGDMAVAYLPISNIYFLIGFYYRDLFFDNFELHGYEPKIKCSDGMDAYKIALNKLFKDIEQNRYR